ncbi:hypothetical protein ACIPZ5_17715 [Pseudomonas sp. NPDC089428]|uniref:hypothetical protein n=1 Tax=Pseudomonas sp. NPDC089428 TaxID=3364467 RepID=UPI0037FBC4A4
MSEQQRLMWNKYVTYLQGFVACVLLSLAILATPIYINWKVDEYQYNNLQAQKNLVDKQMNSIDARVRKIEDRVTDSETKINTQLHDTERMTNKLEDLLFAVDPKVLQKLQKQERSNDKPSGVHQDASPTITVSPIINNGE